MTEPISEEIRKLLLYRERMFDKTFHLFMGDLYNKDTNTWVRSGKPLMNEEGATFFVEKIKDISNPIKITKKLTKEQVNNQCIKLMEEFVDIIQSKHIEFEISDDNRVFLFNLIEHFIYTNLLLLM